MERGVLTHAEQIHVQIIDNVLITFHKLKKHMDNSKPLAVVGRSCILSVNMRRS